MKLISILPVFIWAIAIVLGNYQIISSTQKKIELYHNNPPFRIGSARNSAHLNQLLDSREDTFWERKGREPGEVDFFLELKLTHYYDGSSFTPFPVKDIQWIACPGKTLPKFKARVLLRESINVDKELRLPEDKELIVFQFQEKGKKIYRHNLPLTNLLRKQTHYPEGIYIYTLEMTLPDDLSANDCFAEIRMEN